MRYAAVCRILDGVSRIFGWVCRLFSWVCGSGLAGLMVGGQWIFGVNNVLE